jgi:hypothetical protein
LEDTVGGVASKLLVCGVGSKVGVCGAGSKTPSLVFEHVANTDFKLLYPTLTGIPSRPHTPVA